MKTFLPIIATSKNHSKSSSWRLSPAVHQWRGYPDALGVYLYINCRVWASRKSASTGKFFSNDKMDAHIQTYGFGQNEQGKLVYNMTDDADAEDDDAAAADNEEQQAVDEEEKKGEAPDAPSNATNDALNAGVAALAPAALAPAAAASSVSAAAAAAASPARPGTYVDGIRIPWWFHNRRVHDSDAAVLYRKDPTHYKRFKPHSKKHETYVWPRDIDANHPEQKDELDALAATIAQEAADKSKAKDGTKKKQKPKQPVGDDDEDMQDERPSEDEPAAAAAAAATPPKKRRASSSSPVGISDLSPANTPRAAAAAAAAPAVRTKRSRVAAASSAASSPVAAAAASAVDSSSSSPSHTVQADSKAKKKFRL